MLCHFAPLFCMSYALTYSVILFIFMQSEAHRGPVGNFKDRKRAPRNENAPRSLRFTPIKNRVQNSSHSLFFSDPFSLQLEKMSTGTDHVCVKGGSGTEF